MIKTYNLQIDLKSNTVKANSEMVSQDTTNKLQIVLTDDGYRAVDITGHSISINFKDAKGNVYNQPCSITGNKILCTIATDVIAEGGKVEAELKIEKSSEISRSCLFSFNVRKNLDHSGSVVPSNQLPSYKDDLSKLKLEFDNKLTVEVSKLQSQITSNDEDISNLNNRIDNIIINNGDSSAEVIDSRHDNINNVTHNSLGQRLDSQQNKLNILSEDLKKKDDVEMVVGDTSIIKSLGQNRDTPGCIKRIEGRTLVNLFIGRTDFTTNAYGNSFNIPSNSQITITLNVTGLSNTSLNYMFIRENGTEFGFGALASQLGKNKKILTTPSDAVKMKFYSAVAGNACVIEKTMVLEGSINIDLPYFEGVQSARDSELVSVGENLLRWENNKAYGLSGYGYVSENTKDYYASHIGWKARKIERIYLKPNTTYRFSFVDIRVANLAYIAWQVRFYDANSGEMYTTNDISGFTGFTSGNNAHFKTWIGNNGFEFTTPSTLLYIHSVNGNFVIDENWSVMLVEGAELKPYKKPLKSTILCDDIMQQFPVEDRELRSGDYIEDGVLHRNKIKVLIRKSDFINKNGGQFYQLPNLSNMDRKLTVDSLLVNGSNIIKNAHTDWSNLINNNTTSSCYYLPYSATPDHSNGFMDISQHLYNSLSDVDVLELQYVLATPQQYQLNKIPNLTAWEKGSMWYEGKRKIVLDGSLEWSYHDSYSGFKRVKVSGLYGSATINVKNVSCEKDDGKILSYEKSSTEADSIGVSGVDDVFYISIFDNESGWSSNPTEQQVKDYFNANPYILEYEPTSWLHPIATIKLSQNTAETVQSQGQAIDSINQEQVAQWDAIYILTKTLQGQGGTV